MEQSFSSFTTKEKETVILLCAEIFFTVASLVTIKKETNHKKRYQAQSGTLRIAFAGNSAVNPDPFGGLKERSLEDRPSPSPGVKITPFPVQPKKVKDESFPF